MKKLFKTFSAALLAAACLAPGLAFAEGSVAVSLGGNGEVRVADAADVHSMLVEVAVEGDNAAKVTDVALLDVPAGVVSSAVYDAAAKKATLAFSAGLDALKTNSGSLGTLDVIAEGASAETPVPVQVRLTAMEYLDSADSSTAVKSGSFDGASVSFGSTESIKPNPDQNGGGSNGGPGSGNQNDPITTVPGDGTDGNGSAGGSGSAGGNGGSGSAGNGGTTTADYKANGVVSGTQTGQSTAGGGTGLVKTGDIALISGIAIGAAALCVAVALTVSRRKKNAK